MAQKGYITGLSSRLYSIRALDAAGLVPGFGAIPDLLNASISALRGDWTAAGLSVLAAVPVIGDVATAAKFAQ